MGELPDKIKRIDVLRVEYGKRKLCECRNPEYEIDYKNKLVTCKCGAIVDPFEALYNIALHYERLGDQVQNLLEQRKQIINYKPWLLTFRELESSYRSGKMLPCCPNCGEGFYFETIRGWTNRKIYDARKAAEKLEQPSGK